jgi:hypothetical protein
MIMIGNIDGYGSDDPQRPSYKKGDAPALPMQKQMACEFLSRGSMATITGGDPMNRRMNNYSKAAPAFMQPVLTITVKKSK